jgi:hypothetical protein
MCKIVPNNGEVGPGTQFWPVLRIDLRCSYELPWSLRWGSRSARQGIKFATPHRASFLQGPQQQPRYWPPSQKPPAPGHGTYQGAMIYWIYLAAGEQSSKFKLQPSCENMVTVRPHALTHPARPEHMAHGRSLPSDRPNGLWPQGRH